MANTDLATKQQEMQRKMQGRSEDQKKVIKYFYRAGGCLSSSMSDSEYEAMVQSRLKQFNFKQRALDKIGLDEDQVAEIEPVHFDGYDFDSNDSMAVRGQDNLWRASKYQVTWLFFSADQLYIYQYTFDMASDSTNEFVEEYFYTDVTNVQSASSSTEREVPGPSNCMGQVQYTRDVVNYDAFKIVVPGEKRTCAMKKSDYSESAIRGMKAMLRDKKRS